MLSLVFGHDHMENFEEVCLSRFGRRMAEMLPDDGASEVITLRRGTDAGRPIVMITFQVDVGGVLQRAQTVITMREFVAAADAMRIRYGDLFTA